MTWLLCAPLTALATEYPITPASLEACQAYLRRPDLPDTIRVKYLVFMGDNHCFTDIPAAEEDARQALVLARRIGYRRGEAMALGTQGAAFMRGNKLLLAQHALEQALRVNIAYGYAAEIGETYLLLGHVAQQQEQLAQTLHRYDQARQAYEKIPDASRRGRKLLLVYGNIGSVQIRQKQYALARRSFRQALAATQGDTSRFARNGNGGILLELALLLQRTQQYDSVRLLCQQALAQATRNQDPYTTAQAHQQLAMVALDTHQPALAENHARQGRQLNQQIGNFSMAADCLYLVAQARAAQHLPGAYDSLYRYTVLRDTVVARQHNEALVQAQARFQTAEQQATIRDLQKNRRLATQQQELTRLRTRQQMAGIGGGGVLVLLLLGGLFWQYRRRQLTQRALATTALRTRLAADLHDDVGNLLTQITLQSDLLRESTTATPAQTLARLERLRDTSRRAARQMADVVWGLSTHAATWPELLTHMRDHAYEVLPPANLAIDFGVSEAAAAAQPRQEVSQQLYLIYKECLHNAVKHARQATQVTVRLSVASGQLCLAVHDDAPGPAPVGRAGGQGLSSMQQRAEAVGGSLTVTPGAKGFGVEACLPG